MSVVWNDQYTSLARALVENIEHWRAALSSLKDIGVSPGFTITTVDDGTGPPLVLYDRLNVSLDDLVDGVTVEGLAETLRQRARAAAAAAEG